MKQLKESHTDRTRPAKVGTKDFKDTEKKNSKKCV